MFSILTDYRVVYCFIGISIFCVFVIMQNSNSKTMNIILYVNLIVIALLTYKYFKDQKTNIKVVDNILENIQDDLKDTELKDVAIFKLMMKNDPYQNYAFKTLLKFRDNKSSLYNIY